MTTQSNNGFSRREWLMAITVILMLEAWILNSSYAFKDEQTVINYISFASTIASLLLAVIAIIYGFYQSDGQHKIATALESQIDAMKIAQVNLDSSSQSISSQISAIEDAAVHLERIKGAVEKTHSQLGDLAGGIAEISKKQSSFQDILKGMSSKESQTSKATAGSESISRQLLRRTTYEADLFGYWLYLCDKSTIVQDHDVISLLFSHFVAPLGDAKFDDKDRSVWSNSGFQVLSSLRACNLLTTSKIEGTDTRILNISDGLKSELPTFADEVRAQRKTEDGTKILDRAFDGLLRDQPKS